MHQKPDEITMRKGRFLLKIKKRLLLMAKRVSMRSIYDHHKIRYAKYWKGSIFFMSI
jgi:hypothetical protein